VSDEVYYELRYEVETILGCLESGSKILQVEAVSVALQKVLKQWLLMSEQQQEESQELEEVWDSLDTHLLRQIFRIMLQGRRVNYGRIEEAFGYCPSEHAIESRLKAIRKKLNREKWDFRIHRREQEISWTIRAGKKI